MKRKKVEAWGIQTKDGALVRAERPSGNIGTFPSRDAVVRFLTKNCWLQPYYSPVLLVPADPAKEKELRELRRVFRAAVRWAKSRERFAALWSYDKALLTAVERATRRGR